MKHYTVDLQGWFEIEAEDEATAFAQAQTLIAIMEGSANSIEFRFVAPLELVVAENGITEEA